MFSMSTQGVLLLNAIRMITLVTMITIVRLIKIITSATVSKHTMSSRCVPTVWMGWWITIGYNKNCFSPTIIWSITIFTPITKITIQSYTAVWHDCLLQLCSTLGGICKILIQYHWHLFDLLWWLKRIKLS